MSDYTITVTEDVINLTVTDEVPPPTITVDNNFASIGIPKGGTTGQFLGKNSNADYDVSWKTGSGGGGGLSTKSGIVSGASFAGSPKTFDVLFAAAFSDTNYSILITGADSRSWTYSNKATTGFTINANASQTISGEVSWAAIQNGEA